MALLLSLVGLYGVISYAVSQRTREFGIRVALGASPLRILLMVFGQCVWISALGMVAGAALSWPAIRLLARTLKQTLFLDLTATGPWLFGGLCSCVVLAILLAGFIPAYRATKADPMQALRCE